MLMQEVVSRVLAEDHGPEVHAATVAALPSGRVIAWFGGSKEGLPDVVIWVVVLDEDGEGPVIRVCAEEGVPHWNPVLLAQGDRVTLWFKVGATIAEWATYVMDSADGGRSWSAPRMLVDGDVGGRGPVKNKILVSSAGTWLAPSSRERMGGPWECVIDRSEDGGRTWTESPPITVPWADAEGAGVIQPTLWESDSGIHAFLRSTNGWIQRTDSTDDGRTWSVPVDSPLPSNNSGIDLAVGAGGELYLVSNPFGENWGPRRTLAIDRSRDDGQTWERAFVLEDEEPDPEIKGKPEFAYPAVITVDDRLIVAYTWKRQRIIVREFSV